MRYPASAFIVLIALTGFIGGVQAQSTKRALITEAIDESDLVTLVGNTHPATRVANDRGPVPDDLVLEMYLQLNRPPELQQAMDDLVDQLHDPNSVQYHRWLTVDQIAAHYGPAEADIRTVAGWLAAHGFAVNAVHRANAVIDFSGSARAIRDAFHTQIHNLELGVDLIWPTRATQRFLRPLQRW